MCSANLQKGRNAEVVREVDLVTWTRNAGDMLAEVLRRVEEVIPRDVVKNKIMVDGHSTDSTIEIGKSLGWRVYMQKGTGIAEAANTALKHVVSPFFISIEADLLLAKNWWEKIPKYMVNDNVAVSQGIRFVTHPTLAALDEYFQIDCGKRYATMDNNLYRTELIRKLGGFPDSCPVSVDENLRENVERAGFKWVIDPTVISQHIRNGVREQLRHKYKTYLTRKRDMHDEFSDVWKFFIIATFQSPIRSFFIACKKKRPEIFFVYPMFRFIMVKSCLDRRAARKTLDKSRSQTQYLSIRR